MEDKNYIPLTTETKRILLRWLKDGSLNRMELSELMHEYPVTGDEIEAELRRLAKFSHDEDCARLQEMGFCKYANSNQIVSKNGKERSKNNG